MGLIRSAVLMEETGATYRQIDYWCRLGIIKPEGNPSPGSGSRKMWDTEIVGRVRFLANLSAALDASRDSGFLQKFSDAYDKGIMDLGHDITIVWRK